MITAIIIDFDDDDIKGAQDLDCVGQHQVCWKSWLSFQKFEVLFFSLL